MALEHLQATARDYQGHCLVDGRSDLFSLGVILYELLAGAHPFGHIPDRGTEEEIRNLLYQRQTQGHLPLRAKNPAVDAPLARVVEQCLATDPGQRFQTADELARALRKCGSPNQRLLPRARQHPRTPAAVVAACPRPIVTPLALPAIRP